MIAEGLAQGGAWIADQASGAHRIVSERGSDVGRLVRMGGDPQVLVHPGVVVGLAGDGPPAGVPELPIQPPARIAALGDVHEALALVAQVAIVVDGEQVAIVVEGDFLGIA